MCKEVVELTGNKVMVNTEECTQWKKEHNAENCLNCKYTLGCGKFVKMQLAIICYNSHNHALVDGIIERIIEAKTMSELQAIPDAKYEPDSKGAKWINNLLSTLKSVKHLPRNCGMKLNK
jgi:hypothetical protein